MQDVKGQLCSGSLLGLDVDGESLSESLSSSDVDDGSAAASLRLREAADEDEDEEVDEVGAEADTARCGFTISSEGRGRECWWAGGETEGNGYGDDEDWKGDCIGLNPAGIDSDCRRAAGAEPKGLRKLGDVKDEVEVEDAWWKRAGVDGIPARKDVGSVSTEDEE